LPFKYAPRARRLVGRQEHNETARFQLS
jgi:hypothetical protein